MKQKILILAASLLAPLATLHAAAKPNIIIILADDTGFSDLGCYGGEIDTPNLDALAAAGLRFRQFYNNGRCSPSRASLLTGLESAKVGFAAGTLAGWNREIPVPAYRARLPYDVPLLPELLKGAGYRTFMSGKWHLGGSLMKLRPNMETQWRNTHPGWELTEEEVEADFNALPIQRGFDRFFGIYHGETHQFLIPSSAYSGAPAATTLDGHAYNEDNQGAVISASREYSMRCYYTNTTSYPFHPANGQTGMAWLASDGKTDKAIEMIGEALAADDPFFLYLSFQSPHAPLQAPQDLVDKYTQRYSDLAGVERDRVQRLIEKGIFPADTPFQPYYSGGRVISTEQREKIVTMSAIHAAMTENMDMNIGRVVAAVKNAGAWDNTFIVFLSDNGAAAAVGDLFNKPYRGAKALLWEGGIKTPCIITWPGRIEPGTITDTIGWIGDLFPTSLEIAGVPYPSSFRGRETRPLDGRSLLPALQGESMAPPTHLFFNDKGQQGVIQNGRWKMLIEPGWYADTSKTPSIVYELYDLKKDPAETKNLAAYFNISFDEAPGEIGVLPFDITSWLGMQPDGSPNGLAIGNVSTNEIVFTHPINQEMDAAIDGFYEWSPNLRDWYKLDGNDGPLGGVRMLGASQTFGETTTVTVTPSQQVDALFFRARVTDYLELGRHLTIWSEEWQEDSGIMDFGELLLMYPQAQQ